MRDEQPFAILRFVVFCCLFEMVGRLLMMPGSVMVMFPRLRHGVLFLRSGRYACHISISLAKRLEVEDLRQNDFKHDV